MARQRENTGYQDTYWSKPNKKLMRFLSNMSGPMVTTSRIWEYKHPSCALGVWQGVNARPGDRWGAHLWGGFTLSFDRFWNAYPRKIAKRAALLEWNKLSTEEQNKCVEVIARHCALWKDTDIQFIPHPRTWLHQGRFDDELPEVKVNGKPWQETKTGIEQKGAEMGIYPQDYEHWQWFRNAVMKAAA